jgi:hypothetical protein
VDLSTAFVNIAEAVTPAVVRIEADRPARRPPGAGGACPRSSDASSTSPRGARNPPSSPVSRRRGERLHRLPRRVHPHQRSRGERSAADPGLPAGSSGVHRPPGGIGPHHRRGRPEDRGPEPPHPELRLLPGRAGGGVGPGGGEPRLRRGILPGLHGDGRDHQRHRTSPAAHPAGAGAAGGVAGAGRLRHRGLHPDRRGDQPGELRRPHGQRAGPGGGDQHRHRLAHRVLPGVRLRHPGGPGPAGHGGPGGVRTGPAALSWG